MQASQNKTKIDEESERNILARARAFCKGRDGKQMQSKEAAPPLAFQVENMLRRCPDMSNISSIKKITNSHHSNNTTEIMLNSLTMRLGNVEEQPDSEQNRSNEDENRPQE